MLDRRSHGVVGEKVDTQVDLADRSLEMLVKVVTAACQSSAALMDADILTRWML
jgi:hypothetical protein